MNSSIKINTTFLSDGRFKINAFVNDEAKPSRTFIGEKNAVSRMFNLWAAQRAVIEQLDGVRLANFPQKT